mmetsp:Transcript_23237/g.58723  ORF Transcript_23237/g.58723 Transcript_23237/m.58723 type:complete len:261 (-) Transcript_23237:437-1219(-)
MASSSSSSFLWTGDEGSELLSRSTLASSSSLSSHASHGPLDGSAPNVVYLHSPAAAAHDHGHQGHLVPAGGPAGMLPSGGATARLTSFLEDGGATSSSSNALQNFLFGGASSALNAASSSVLHDEGDHHLHNAGTAGHLHHHDPIIAGTMPGGLRTSFVLFSSGAAGNLISGAAQSGALTGGTIDPWNIHDLFHVAKTGFLLFGGLCSKMFGMGLIGFLAFQSMTAPKSELPRSYSSYYQQPMFYPYASSGEEEEDAKND